VLSQCWHLPVIHIGEISVSFAFECFFDIFEPYLLLDARWKVVGRVQRLECSVGTK